MDGVASAFTTLRIERGGHVATVTLAAPPANLLGAQMFADLRAAFDALGADGEIRAVVVTGEGRAFCGGADIAEFTRIASAEDAHAIAARGDFFDVIEAFPKPVIAAIDGVAAGGGCELALACDVRVMARSATIGLPEARLGLVADWGGVHRLVQLAGRGRALHLLCFGVMIDGETAARDGIVEAVCDDGTALHQARELAALYARSAPLALAGIKAAVAAALRNGPARSLDLARATTLGLLGSADTREGVTAFLEKRAPVFTGR